MSKSNKTPFAGHASIISQVFELARKGTTVNAICAYVRERGGDPMIILRTLRRCTLYGFVWRVEEMDGTFKIIFPVE